MNERRQLPRWKIKKEARLLMPETHEFTHAVVEDMHLKGMCLSTIEPLFHQQVVNMSFAIEDNNDVIAVKGHVPWAKEDHGLYTYGIEFADLKDEDKDKIYQYISAHCFDQFKIHWWMKD